MDYTLNNLPPVLYKQFFEFFEHNRKYCEANDCLIEGE